MGEEGDADKEVGVSYRINVGGVGVRGSQALATFQNGCEAAPMDKSQDSISRLHGNAFASESI